MQDTAKLSFWTLVVQADNLLGGRGRDAAANLNTATRATFLQPSLREPLPDGALPHLVLATDLAGALSLGRSSQDPDRWNTLVTQNTVPDLVRGWVPEEEFGEEEEEEERRRRRPRIRWEKPASRIDVNHPVSCIRTLGVIAKLGDEGTWASSDKRGDPLLAAVVEVIRGKTQDRDLVCEAANRLHEAARILLMARKEIHVVSPQAVTSRETARMSGRPDALFYGGADDGAHTEVAALVQNWLGGRPDVTTAWAAWNLASEVGPGEGEVANLFLDLDYDADQTLGSTLRSGQEAFPRVPEPLPPPREPTPRLPPTEAQQMIRRLNRELSESREAAARLQTMLTQKDTQIEGLEAEIARKDARIAELQRGAPPADVDALIRPKLDQLNDLRTVLDWLQVDFNDLRIITRGLRADDPQRRFRAEDLRAVLEVRRDERNEPEIVVRDDAVDRFERWEQGPTSMRLLALPCRAEAHFPVAVRARAAEKLGRRPSMITLTRNLVEAVLTTARDEQLGRPLLRQSIQNWTRGNASVAASLRTVCDNVLVGKHHLREPYAGLGLVNGYQTCFRDLMRQVSETAHQIRAGGCMPKATDACLARAARVGASIGEEWRET